MSRSIVMANAAATELQPEPIPQNWIHAGTPDARSAKVAKSRDFTSYVMVWECSEGRFTWQYTKDETLVVLSGETLITNGDGTERRLGPGDFAFFPAGTSATWEVTRRIRKVAVVREAMPTPIGLVLRVWNKLLRVAGIAGKSLALVPALNLEDWLAG